MTTVRVARVPRCHRAGLAEADWRDDGECVRVRVADPDGDLVELYAR